MIVSKSSSIGEVFRLNNQRFFIDQSMYFNELCSYYKFVPRRKFAVPFKNGGNIMKRNNLLMHRTGLAVVCISCALSLSACGSNKNENRDPITGADMSETQESSSAMGSENNSDMASGEDYSEFDRMIGDENTDPNTIIDYINTNANESNAQRFLKGLLGFGSDLRNIDLSRLDNSKQYMPQDVIAFIELMRLEASEPSMILSDQENRRVINMPLRDMLERAIMFEQHLKKYPNNVTTDAAAKLYEEIATNAISGGYDRAAGISHQYKGEAEDVVNKELLQRYQEFAAANADSNLGRIVQEYIDVLQTNQFKINDAMEEFYRGLSARLDVNRWANAQNSTNGNNQTTDSTTNGTGNGTNGEAGTTVPDENSTNKTGATNENTTNGNTTNENNTTNNSSASTHTGATDTVIQGTISR